MFLTNDSYKTDGIAMFNTIIEHLEPTHANHLLATIMDLFELTYKATCTSIPYMKTVCKISEHLKGANIIQLMPLFAIANLDQDKYPGLMPHYLADDPALVHANLLSLGQK